MTESDEYRFEFLPKVLLGGGLGRGDSFEILICRLLGVLKQYVEVNETL